MAHIFKNPTPSAKGIILFTHKEMAWFFRGKNKTKLIKSFVKNPSLRKGTEIIKNPLSKFVTMYQKIRDHYYIGVHIGWDPAGQNLFDNCDFYLAADAYDMKKVENIFRIPIVSRNFTPKCFYNRHQKKYWDIISISRNPKHKNLNQFLKSIRKIYDLGYDFKVLLISPKNKNENDRFYTSLMDDYYSLFSYYERQNFSLLRLSSDVAFPGLSHELMAHFYNSAKIFTLFSQVEGSPKAVSEALCCGLPVVIKRDQRGGAKDFLDKTNSVFFDTYDNAHEVLIHAVKNYENFNIDSEKQQKALGEENSLAEIKEYFNTLYEKNGQKFDGELINTDRLNVRIPGHLNEDVEWVKTRFETADIFSDEQLAKFMKNLDLETYKNNSNTSK